MKYSLLLADLLTSLGTAGAQNAAAPHRLHAFTETMDFLTFTFVRLISSFHEKTTIPLNLRGPAPASFAEIGEKSGDSILKKRRTSNERLICVTSSLGEASKQW